MGDCKNQQQIVIFSLIFLIIFSIITTSNISIASTDVTTRVIFEAERTLSMMQKEIRNLPAPQNHLGFATYCADTLDWGVDAVEADWVFGGYENATDIGGNYTGDGIKVAVIDSGIDKQSGSVHHDFTGKIVDEYDFYYGDFSANDEYGHGTHCAGIIGARDDDDGMIGMAPECDFIIARVMNQYGQFTTPSGVASAIDWAVSHGADIISISWGTSSDIPAIKKAIEDAYAAGVVIVAAAGNDDADLCYPAKYY